MAEAVEQVQSGVQDGGAGIQSGQTSVATTSAGVADAGVGTATSPGGQTAAAVGFNVREYLKSQGANGTWESDEAAMQAVLGGYRTAHQRLRDAEQVAELGRQVAPHWQQYQKWLQEQQAQSRQTEQAKKDWWKAPEWDQTWMQGVVIDPETGQMRAAPGYPADLPNKIAAAQQHQRNFLQRLSMEFPTVLKEALQNMLPEFIQPALQENVGRLREEMHAQSLVNQSPWLFEKGQDGRPARGPDGRPQLSVAGRAYHEALVQLEQQGVRDIGAQHALAQQAAENAMMREKLKQFEAGQINQQKRNEFAGTPPNHSGSLASGLVQNEKLSLGEELRRRLEGVSIN